MVRVNRHIVFQNLKFFSSMALSSGMGKNLVPFWLANMNPWRMLRKLTLPRLLAGDNPLPSAPLARATQQYVERLRELSAAQPSLLVAHAYVRYLGDLNGGQALRRVVARSLGLAGSAGTMFYDFGDSTDRQHLMQRFRTALKTVDAQAQPADAIVAEAIGAFERHEQLFEQLALTA